MIFRIILILLLTSLTIKVSYCESLNIDQKISVLFELINQRKVSPDFFCYFYSRIFEVYFNLEVLQSTQDIKDYFNVLFNDYLSKPRDYCGNDECFHKIYDRLRMLKRLFNNENFDFLVFCKNSITNRSLTQSFDEGRIMELYDNLCRAFEQKK